MDWAQYKKYHELWMQNNDGSSPYHTFSCILFTVLCAIIASLKVKLEPTFQYLYEYFIVTLPLILIHTVFTDYLYLGNITLILILCYYCVKNYSKNYVIQESTINKGISKSISYMRALTYLITVYSILAVDFKVFPRYLSKTETYGYSLMDTGVGLFMFMSGLVHKFNYTADSLFQQNFRLILTLIALGITRCFSVKHLDYHEHVTEYGVHMNFFFTVAATKTICTVLLCLVPFSPLFLAVFVMIVHEFLLNAGLEKWVFSNEPRDNFISANREGLVSILGYVAMYLFAVYIKTLLTNKSTPRKVLYKLSFYSLCLWLVVMLFTKPASRRLANSSYCIYMSAIVMTVSTLLYYLEISFSNFTVPLTLEAINVNGLLYFFFANLFTGIMNLSMRTLLLDNVTALIVLNVYMIAMTVMITGFKHLGLFF